MSTVWAIILAVVAGAGGHATSQALEGSRSRPDPSIRAGVAGPSRTLSIARKSWHRSSPGLCSWAGTDEVDTEEVDETWMVHLDAVATVPARWLCRAWSRSASGPKPPPDPSSPPPLDVPLRC